MRPGCVLSDTAYMFHAQLMEVAAGLGQLDAATLCATSLREHMRCAC